MNISDIPISLAVYQKFMYNCVVNTRKNTFVIPEFLRHCLKKGGLLDLAIKQWAEVGVAPSVIKDFPDFSSTIFTTSKLKSSLAKKEFVSPKDIPGAQKTISSSNEKEECDYFLIYQKPTKSLSSAGPGIKRTDALKGIYHFEIGKNRGLLKNISFSKLETELMQEQFMTNQVGMYDELKMTYNASITMFGNNLFVPGSKIFINPGTIGLGDPLDKQAASYRLGFGGYYNVLSVSTSIVDGVSTTTLECYHESHADKRAGYPTPAEDDTTVPKSGDIQETLGTSPDTMPLPPPSRKIEIPDYYGAHYMQLIELEDEDGNRVLTDDMAAKISYDFSLHPSDRPESFPGLFTREIDLSEDPPKVIIYNLTNGVSIKVDGFSFSEDSVSLVTTSKTFPA